VFRPRACDIRTCNRGARRVLAGSTRGRVVVVKLFVFGTLKRGFPLHELGLDGAACLGVYRTLARYPMLIAGPWYAPMMLPEPGHGHRVLGELYEVEPARLALIDAIESVGVPGNLRLAIEVEALDGTVRSEAFAYFKERALAAPTHGGLLAEYQDRRFIPPWLR